MAANMRDGNRRRRGWRNLGAGVAVCALLVTAACGGSGAPTETVNGTQPARPLTPRTPTPRAGAAATLTGALDTTFGAGGLVTTDFGSTNEEARDVAVLPDGKIVVAGTAWPPAPENGRPKITLARYTADGSLDPGFGDGGKVFVRVGEPEYNYSDAQALAVQPDGKLVVVGMAVSLEYNHTVFAVVRYNADGSPDTGFGTGGQTTTAINPTVSASFGDEAQAVALAPDGKILVAGIGGDYPQDTVVVRYNADGSLDDTFGQAGIVTSDFGSNNKANAVTVQPDGKILVAGIGSREAGIEYDDFALLRYNADGSPDATFGDNGMVLTDFGEGQDWAYDIALRPDGKIVLAGPVTDGVTLCGSSACRTFGFGLAQYNPDGSLDPGFGDGGKVSHSFNQSDGNYALLRLADGTLLTAGHTNNNDFALGLFNADGTVVTSFGSKGLVHTPFSPSGATIDRAYALALQPDGKLVVVGGAVPNPDDLLNGDFALARYR